MILTSGQDKYQYIKSLGWGQHVLKDLATNRLEVYGNSKNYAGYRVPFKNTHLEFCGGFDPKIHGEL